MRLRNKRTGEILEVVAHRAGDYRDKFDSLAELNKEWEDYQEPKDIKYYYCISMTGDVHELVYYGELTQAAKDKMAIGNYFETREEAEQAVEKLKAWKRLKDKGFKFDGYDSDFEGMGIIYPNDCSGNWCWMEDKKDLDLLFGDGE